MAYVEEREFTLQLQLRCEFPEDYQGEADGYAWAAELPALTQEIVHAAIAAIARHPRWKVHPGNRGRSTEDEVLLVLDREISGA